MLFVPLCCYIGNVVEVPPEVSSICPPHVTSIITPANEPYTYVEGIMVQNNIQLVQFKVPVAHSLLFGMLASDVIISHVMVPDSVVKRLCPVPLKAKSPEDVFSGKANSAPTAIFHSHFINSMPRIHTRRLLLLSFFIIQFFIIDGIVVYRGSIIKNTMTRLFFCVVDCFFYVFFCGIGGLLLLDVLLPESAIINLSSFFAPITSIAAACMSLLAFAGGIRIIAFVFKQ